MLASIKTKNFSCNFTLLKKPILGFTGFIFLKRGLKKNFKKVDFL